MTGLEDGGAPQGLHALWVGLPVGLYDAAEAHWRGLLRDYVLRGFGGTAQVYAPAEVARCGSVLDAFTDAVHAVHAGPGAPPTTAPAAGRADVVLSSAGLSAGDVAMLQGALEDAGRLSRAGELLILPPLPEVVALGNWLCDQVGEQAAGGEASAWLLQADGPETVLARTSWDPDIEPAGDTCWLIGDDHNRIVAASTAALHLLGWREDQLVGQRLLSVIPPAYREAHLAAFTRSVLGGRGHILGVPAKLPALASDGSEVPVTLTLTRHSARAGRVVYLGVMVPRLSTAADV